MNSSFKGSIIKPLFAEDIRQFIAAKSVIIDDKTKRKIEAVSRPNSPYGKINRLIVEFNTARQICSLLPGLTRKQREELSRLVELEKEFKQRHQQKQAKPDDYKNFIAVQRKILPLDQTVTWWNSNHETFMNDDFWKKLNNTAKMQSKNHKESESEKRKRLHKLVDIKEDYNNYQAYYAYSSEDLIDLHHRFVLPLENAVRNLVLHHAKQKKPYHAVIVEYLSSLLRTLEDENKLMIYSMAYRLKCADYFKSNNCDDLMAYTLSRVYHHANIPKQDNKITPARRSGLTPDQIKLFCRLIQEHAKSHPDDALIQSKLEELSDYFYPSKQASDKKLKRANSEEPVQKPEQHPATILTQHHSDLGHLILSIEDAVNTINNSDAINTSNLGEFIAQYEATILTTTELLLSSNSTAFDFKTLLLCSNALYSFLCPRIKGMLLAANGNEIENNPHWYHLANHLGSHHSMQNMLETIPIQGTSPQFKEVLRFSTHFARVKHKLNHSIKSSLLKEANISIAPDNNKSFPDFLQTLSSQQLLDFWSVCAKKLKTNHVISPYDPLYALKMAKYLTHASSIIYTKAQNDHRLREKFIRMLPILNTIRADINTCLQKQARSTQFHYLFSGQMNADTILNPVINVIDKILTLQLKYKLESYIKNYANDEAKLAVLMTLRNKLNDVIEGRQHSQSLPDTIDTIVKEAADNKAVHSYPFNRSLQNFSALSKQYFAGDNERVFTKHPEKICSLLG